MWQVVSYQCIKKRLSESCSNMRMINVVGIRHDKLGCDTVQYLKHGAIGNTVHVEK